ncbi:MAG: hypothetical protein IPK87_06095 [Planctomycetes bacterium]|nr:hypothetical protein [Planctomycetota bacterium]
MARSERKERLIEQMLSEKLGGKSPPDLSSRILQSLDQPAGRVLAARPLHAGARPASWRSVAASVALVGAVGIAAAVFLLNMPRNGTTPVADSNRSTKPALPDQSDPKPVPQKPEPEMRAPEQQPEPDAPIPEMPKPVPEPQPKPEPEPEPAPAPQPGPEKPREDVENPPEPKPERPPTEAPVEPSKAVVVAQMLQMTDGAKLAFKRNEADRWEEWTAETQVESGMFLRARKPVALSAGGNARVYFNGELRFTGDESALSIELFTEAVYVEAYAPERTFTVSRGDASFNFREAEVVAEKSGLKLNVTCLGGEVSSGGVALAAGWSASLSEKGFAKPKEEGDKLRAHTLVIAVDTIFRLVRDELDDERGDGRIYLGVAENGIVTGTGKQCFGVTLTEPYSVRDNAYVRVRMRVRGSQGVSIGVKGDEAADWQYFQHHTNHILNDKWITLKVPLHDLKVEGKADKAKPLATGQAFTAFQVVLWDEKATIEIDWIEFGIDPKWGE